MSTTTPTTVRRPAPQWVKLLLVVVVTAVVMIGTLAVIHAALNRTDPGEAYVATVREAMPSGVTGQDADILAAATKACEAGDAGLLNLQQAAVSQGYAPTAIVQEIVPALNRYCASR